MTASQSTQKNIVTGDHYGRRPTAVVWRRGDPLPAPEPMAPAMAKPRIPAIAVVAKVIVVKADPSVAIEAARKAQAARDAKAAIQRRREEKAKADTELAALQAAELERVEEERNRRDALRKAEENCRLAWLNSHSAAIPKPKATEAPKVSQKAHTGVSLEELRAKSVVGVAAQPAPRIGLPKPIVADSYDTKWKPRKLRPGEVIAKSAYELEVDARKCFISETTRRISELDSSVVARLHRDGCGVRKTWPTPERMLEVGTAGYLREEALLGMIPFIQKCEEKSLRSRK